MIPETVMIKKEDADYPRRMKELGRMPRTLYLMGRLPDDDRPSAAVVGARMCSGYGRDAAYRIGFFLAEHGVQVVSGLAVGVDGTAQQGALDAGGDVFAVLASGPDVCYPITNYPVYEGILKQGGVVSEHPPGTRPLAPYFPSRNRIISALADIVIVVEARERSGSLITVDFALEQGRTVLAVPGRFTDPLSDGCNRLIAQGAGIICSPGTILEELETLWSTRPAEKTGFPAKNVSVANREKAVNAGSAANTGNAVRFGFSADTGAAVKAGPDVNTEKAVNAGPAKKERRPGSKKTREERVALSPGAAVLLKLLGEHGRLTPDEAAGMLSIPVPAASAALMELVLSGAAREAGRGRFEAVRRSHPK